MRKILAKNENMYFIYNKCNYTAPFTRHVADHCRNLVVGTVTTKVPSFFSPYTKLFPFHHIVFPLFQAPVRCVLTMLSSSFFKVTVSRGKAIFALSGFPPLKIMWEFQIYVPLSTFTVRQQVVSHHLL